MTITDIEVSRLETIVRIIDTLLDEAKEIVKSTDDYAIQNKAESCWITVIRHALHHNEKVITMQDTINELWEEYHREPIL